MIRVGIIGGTGYTGIELVRLLAAHPEVELELITSRSRAGTRVDAEFPSLRGICNLEFCAPDAAPLAQCEFLFFATPTGTAMKMVPEALSAGARVVDLSADFRLRDAVLWSRWHGVAHGCPELLTEAVYGLPELNREAIRNAALVANPGCYPTSVQLGFLPLVERGIVDVDRLIADTKSGLSGAGRKTALATQFCEAGENMKAYAASGHRHHPEIVQGLSGSCGRPVQLTFVPHLTPMIRGIHATLYAPLLDTASDIQEIFESRYAGEPFIDVMPANSHPETRSVRGANVCRISWHRPSDGTTLVILSVLDNLVKGAAGQAVQNMNIMLGFREETGLMQPALVP